MPEINQDDFNKIQDMRESGADVSLDTTHELPPWEHEDAPAGSTEGSLLVYERGVAVRVAGPTHYVHLADGRVKAGYGIGTHYSEPGARKGGPDKITPIIGIHPGS